MTQVALSEPELVPSLALLPLKLVSPVPRSELVPRPDLQALLADVRLRPVTLLIAPAGYGKTTLLSQWAVELTSTGARVAWVSFDHDDRDPAMLLAYLIRAFQLSLPEIGEEAWRILHSLADLEQDWMLVMRSLMRDLQQIPARPTFLLIDDYHQIAEGPITAALLTYLLRSAPPTLHVVIASRRPLDLTLFHRMRTEGSLLEIEQSALALSRTEADQLLQYGGVRLRDAELSLLLERSEGWALSLQLAARALAQQSSEQRQAYLQNLHQSQRGLLDYLAADVVAGLPSDLLDLLTLAALTEQFDAELLREVLGYPFRNGFGLDGVSDGQPTPFTTYQTREFQELITRAIQLGLPITYTGTSSSTVPAYRLHPLWRHLLRERSAQLLNHAIVTELHLRYGAAFERRGMFDAAIGHYTIAGSTEAMASLLRRRAWPLIDTPQRDTIRAWIERMPERYRTSDPEILHLWGWSVAAADYGQAFQAISRAAELYQQHGSYQRELRALSDLAALTFWDDRPTEFAAIAIRAVRAANRVGDRWARGAALAATTALLYSRGRYAAALRVASQATRYPRNAFWQWLLAMIVTAIHSHQGYPERAAAAVTQALAMPQAEHDDRLYQNLRLLHAFTLYQQGAIGEAVNVALDAHLHLVAYAQESVIGVSSTLLALLLIEQGAYDEAASYTIRARGAAHLSGNAALLGRVQIIEAYRELRTGQMSSAAGELAQLVSRGMSPFAHDLLLPAFGAHDLWLQLYALVVLGEGGELERAMALAESLSAEMRRRGDGLFLAATQLYRAVLAERGGLPTPGWQAGWVFCEQQQVTFLPALPLSSLEVAVSRAITHGLALRTVSALLCGQLRDRAHQLLLHLLEQQPEPAIRVTIAQLLGDLGTARAFSSLRLLLKDSHAHVRQTAEQALNRLVYRPGYRLQVRTLGAFTVWRGDVEVRDRDWRSIKARQLLQLLLVERGRMLSRDQIMELLWPELESEAAANNLRVTLSRLIKALEPERPDGVPTYYIVQQGETYGFNVESDHRYDAYEFGVAVEQGRTALSRGETDEAIRHFRQAINAYAGPFLPDCLYEDWSLVERERLGLLFAEAALQLGRLLLDQQQAHEAIGCAWRVLEYDQAQEEAYQLLMRAYSSLGERTTALRLYTRCVSALDQELGVDPLPETIALYEHIRGM